MSFVLSINGRAVVPVRALPWVTGRDGEHWHLDAVEVARALGCDKGFTDFAAVQALRIDGRPVDVDEWHRLAEALRARRATRDWARDEWQLHATRMLPAGVYVDADAWGEAYERCPDGPGPLRDSLSEGELQQDDLAEAQARKLDYTRALPAAETKLVLEGFGNAAGDGGATDAPHDGTANIEGHDAVPPVSPVTTPLAAGSATTDWTPRRRADLLKEFRALEGKRRTEAGKKGKRGALMKLVRKTAVDKDTLGDQLDKAIAEKKAADMWEQLNTAK